MSTYKVEYVFNGRGTATVEARSKEKAVEAFFNGEFEGDKEEGSDYEIVGITK